VIDGARALRVAIETVFGERAEVQRCQIHKSRNVKDHLQENCQRDYHRRIRNASAMTNSAEAKAELEKSFRQLVRVNPSATHNLEEGMEKTLTVHHLNVGELPRRTLSSSNPIEPCLSTGKRVTRNLKRRRGGDQALRWTATGLLKAEKKLRRVKRFRELEVLHRRLNPQCLCPRCQTHRERSASLTQQEQVA
jgi:putative transposase